MTSPSTTTIPVVRRLRPDDLDAVIALDAKVTGRRREEFFRQKLRAALAETGIEVSLAADSDGLFTGFLLTRVYYGEFGLLEKAAVLDTIGVHPDFRHQGVGHALMRQLYANLAALGIPRLQTEVGWSDIGLMSFFQQEGFAPAPRFCLDRLIDPTKLEQMRDDL